MVEAGEFLLPAAGEVGSLMVSVTTGSSSSRKVSSSLGFRPSQSEEERALDGLVAGFVVVGAGFGVVGLALGLAFLSRVELLMSSVENLKGN